MENSTRKQTSVLVVDDDPDLRKIAQMSLALKGGFLVEVRESGEEALELVQKWPPDIILLDAIMPRMDGFETCQRLKADPDRAPRIVEEGLRLSTPTQGMWRIATKEHELFFQ